MSRTDELIRLTVERYKTLWDTFDRVVVGCSGGKDSTILVETGLIAAREADRQLEVWFWDEEVIPPETVEYMNRMRERNDPHLDLHWLCEPVREINGFSREQPYWFPWDKDARALWVREKPSWAAPTPPGFRPGSDLIENTGTYIQRALMPKTMCNVIGLRAQESPARSAGLQQRWLFEIDGATRLAGKAAVIGEWLERDVWSAIREHGWDWNRYYLTMYRAGKIRQQRRVGPLFGEESSINAGLLTKVLGPLWPKACLRIPGVSNVARYADTPLMGRGRAKSARKVTGEITKEALREHYENLPESTRIATAHSVRSVLTRTVGGLTIPLSKRRIGGIHRIVLRGDSKAARLATAQSIGSMSEADSAGRYLDRRSPRDFARKVRHAAETQRKEKAKSEASD